MKLQLALALIVAALVCSDRISQCPAQEAPAQEAANQGGWLAELPDRGAPPAPQATSVVPQPEVAPSPEVVPAELSTSSEVSTAVRELSVAPVVKPLLPADRPSWVGAPPDLANSTHRLFVGSYPVATPEETDSALDEPLVAAVNGYIDETILEGSGSEKLGLTAAFIRNQLVDRSTHYDAELSTSQEPMYQKWVVVQISAEDRAGFLNQYQQVEQRKRLVALGLGAGGLMMMTGLANFAFKRRRRRYESGLPPGTYALVGSELPPVIKSKPKRSVLPKLLVGAVLGVVVPAGFLALARVQRNETVQMQTVRRGTVELLDAKSEHVGENVVESSRPVRRTTRVTNGAGRGIVEIHSESR